MIDTHIHIDEEAYDADREEVIARQQAEGVTAMVVPGVNVASIDTVLAVCRAHKSYCYAAMGLHPEEVKADWQEAITQIEQAARANRDELVAIGEVGLDYHYDTTYKSEQQEAFARQIRLAQELDLPLIIHNREATEDTLRILKQSATDHPLQGVFHCYSGSRETAQEIIKMGFYLGIGGVLTFKNSKLKEHLSAVPLERLLLETDGPYMAPVPHRGERNESRWMIHVVDLLADVYCTTPQAIIDVTTRNAKQLFRL